MLHRETYAVRLRMFMVSRIFKSLLIAIFASQILSPSVLRPVLASCNVTAEIIQRVMSFANATVPIVNICALPGPVPWHIYPEGSRCSQNLCDAGFFGLVGVRCVNSTLVPERSDSCRPCWAGSFCALNTNLPITCPYGSYSLTGSAAPSICPVNSWSERGSKRLLDCVSPCPIGWICDGIHPAYTCPQGTFSNITGATSISTCTTCPVTAFCPGGSEVRYCPDGEIGQALFKLVDPRMDLDVSFNTFGGLSRDGKTAVLVYPLLNTSTSTVGKLYGAFVYEQHLGIFEQQVTLLQSRPQTAPVTKMSSNGGVIIITNIYQLDSSDYANFDIWLRDPINHSWTHTELATNQYLCDLDSSNYGSLYPDVSALSGDGSFLAVALLCSSLDQRIIFFEPNSTNSSAPWTKCEGFDIPLGNADLEAFSSMFMSDDGTILSCLYTQFYPTDPPPRMLWYSRTSSSGNWTLQSQPILDGWLGNFTSANMNPRMSSDGQVLIFLRSPDDATYGTFVFVRSSPDGIWIGPVFTTTYVSISLDVAISSNGQYIAILADTVGTVYNRTENGTSWTLASTIYPTDDNGAALLPKQFTQIALSDDGGTILFLSTSIYSTATSASVPSVAGSTTNCIRCPSGNICAPGNPIVECPIGYWCGPAAQSANRCPSGTWTFNTGTTSMDQCLSSACVAGSYCNGTADIQLCPSGTYSPSSGLSSVSGCTLCSSGTSSSVRGSSISSDCLICDEPTYAPSNGMTLCSTCESGSQWIGSDECTECSPPNGCDGSSQCRIGYAGIQCVDCVSGYYHPTDLISSCAECGSTAVWVIPVVIIVLLLTAGLVVKLNSSPLVRLILIPLHIGLPYMQILSFIRQVDLSWPKSTRSGFALFSLSAFNLRAITEESCIISFQTQFGVTLAFPLIVALPLIGVYLGWTIFVGSHDNAGGSDSGDVVPSNPTVEPSSSNSSSSHSSLFRRIYGAFGVHSYDSLHQRLIQTIVSLLSFAYMFLATTSVTIFDCIPIGIDHRVREFVGLRCGSQEWRNEYLPFAILGTIFYAIGIPILLLSMTRSPQIRSYLMFQWSQLKMTHYGFIPIQLIWELCQAIVIRFGGQPTTKIILCSILFLLRAISIIYLRPYMNIWHQREEILLSILSVIILISGSIFYVSDAGSTSKVHEFFLVIVWLCIISMILIVILGMAYAWWNGRLRNEQKSNLIKSELEKSDEPTMFSTETIQSTDESQTIPHVSPVSVEMVEIESIDHHVSPSNDVDRLNRLPSTNLDPPAVSPPAVGVDRQQTREINAASESDDDSLPPTHSHPTLPSDAIGTRD